LIVEYRYAQSTRQARNDTIQPAGSNNQQGISNITTLLVSALLCTAAVAADNAKETIDLNNVGSATAFDRSYVKAQLKAYEDAVSLFRRDGKDGQAAPLKAFAQ
jgi:hypothetical protein